MANKRLKENDEFRLTEAGDFRLLEESNDYTGEDDFLFGESSPIVEVELTASDAFLLSDVAELGSVDKISSDAFTFSDPSPLTAAELAGVDSIALTEQAILNELYTNWTPDEVPLTDWGTCGEDE